MAEIKAVVELIDLAAPLIQKAIAAGETIPAETLKLVNEVGNWHGGWAGLSFLFASMLCGVALCAGWRWTRGGEGIQVLTCASIFLMIICCIIGVVNAAIWLNPLGYILTNNLP